MPKTVTLTFTQDVIQEHIDRHNGAIIPLNTEAEAWCKASCNGGWQAFRRNTAIGESVIFDYVFALERDASLFMMFHEGATSE